MRSLPVWVLVLTFTQSAGLCEEQERNWPFTPVQSRQPPVVKNSAWVSNEIDRFILARLESSGLAPAGGGLQDEFADGQTHGVVAIEMQRQVRGDVVT